MLPPTHGLGQAVTDIHTILADVIVWLAGFHAAAIEGQVLRENTSMLAMCREFGFEITADPNDVGICTARLTPIR